MRATGGESGTDRPCVSGLDDWRESSRFDVTGTAFWSAGRLEGSCQILNFSLGGVEIANPRPTLEIGSRLRVLLVIDDVRLEAVPVEVVRLSPNGVGLRYVEPSEALETQLQKLIYKLQGAV